MTNGTNKTKQTVLTLTPDETKVFKDGHLIIDRKFCRKGIFEIHVQTKQVCPTLATRNYLRTFIHTYNATSQSVGNGSTCNMTVDGVLALGEIIPDTFAADLRRYRDNLGGEVPITELV